MKKIIKKSNRGVTFSFNGRDTKFQVGDKFRYIVDCKKKKIYIIPSDEKKSLTISRKKMGTKIKSLIDLRAKKVLEAVSDADFLEVKIKSNTIIIDVLKNQLTSNEVNEKNKIINLKSRLKKAKKIKSIQFEQSLLNKAVGESSNFIQETVLKDFLNQESDYSINISEDVQEDVRTTIKVISVFSGAGMFDYPLYLDKDFEIIQAIELNKAAVESYKENIKGVNIVNEDIRNFKITETLKNVDCIWGGCPCTPYSNANRINSLDAHKDIDLLQEYLRLIKTTQTKTFVLENVPQLISAKGGLYFENFKEQLKQYNITNIILCDCDLGGFTNRKRAFIFGSRIGNIAINIIKKKARTVREALKKVTKKWFNYFDFTKPSKETEKRMSLIPMGGNWSNLPKELWQPSYKIGKTHSNTYRRLELDKPSVTLANFRKCNLIHPTQNRGLTVAEASALSGFDENIKFKGSLADRQLQVSNAVPFEMGKVVKNILKNFIFKYLYGNNIYAI